MGLRQHESTRTLLQRLFSALLLCAVSVATSCASRSSRVQDVQTTPATENTETESESESRSGSEPGSEAASDKPADSADPEVEKAAEAWKPPEPGSDKFDWIRLKSGEWLKGDLTYMRNRTLEFDSDELDELKLDWKDVAEVRSPRMNTILLEGKIQHTGTLLIRDDVVIMGGEEPFTYPRDQLVSIVPGEERERDYWSGRISVGTTFRSGNTDQTDVTARGTLYRRTALTRTTLDYTGSITTLDGKEEVNNHRASAVYSVYLTTDFYAIPFAVEYYKDRIANIQHRITPGAGAGYWLMDSPDVEWNVDLLGGYRYTEFETVEAGDDRTVTTAAVIAASKLDWEITNDLDLLLEYRITFGLDDIADTNHYAVSTLSVDLTKVLDLDVSFIWDHEGQPQRSGDGDSPKNDDYRLVVGLGVDF